MEGLKQGYTSFGLGQNPYWQGYMPVMMMHQLIAFGVRFRSSDEAIAQGVAYVPASRHAEGIFHTMSVRDNSGFLRLRRIARRLTAGCLPAS